MAQAQIGGEAFRAVIETVRGPVTTVAIVLVLLVAGWYLSGAVARFFARGVRRQVRRESVVRIVLRAIRGVVLAGILFVMLPIVGFAPQNLLVSATVISAVIGVVLAPIAQGFISGAFVLVNQPYEVGDMIELVGATEENGTRGYVDDITLRYTRIVTLDNTFLLVPNETIGGRDIINLSDEDERTRVSIELTVSYEGDLEEARSRAERAVTDIDGVIEGGPEIRIGSARYPARPRAFIREFADHGVLLDLRFWVRQPYFPARMRSQIHENLWEAFEDADVEFPYPHTHLVFDETSGQAQVEIEAEQAFAEMGVSHEAESAAD